MRAMSIVLVSTLLLLDAAGSHAQTKLSTYRRVLVFRDTADAISGRLISVDGNALQVLTIAGERLISRSEVTKVIVRGEPRQPEGVGYGILLGGYASLLALGARDRSGTFLHSRLSEAPGAILLALLPGIGLGAGVGYVIDSGPKVNDELFDFAGGQESAQAAWERLSDAIKQREQPRFHLSVQGAQLLNFSFDDAFFSDSYSRKDFSTFNLIRKLQLTYSILPQLEVGIAMAPFGELGFERYRYTNPSPTQSQSLSLEKSVKSISYHLVAVYRPPRQYLPERLGITIGGGLGWTSLEYHRNIKGNIYDFGGSTSTEIGPFPFTVSHTGLSGIVFSEVYFQVHEGLTVGLIVDRLVMVDQRDPGEPSFSYTPTTIDLATWSIGFQLSVHF